MKKKSKKIRVLGFFTQAKNELKKVTWPTKDTVVKMTLIVIIISAAVGGFIGVLDYLFIKLTGTIIK